MLKDTQANGGIERMHYTLTEFRKQYVEKKWVGQVDRNMPARIQQEKTWGYFPPREQLLTYDDYLDDTTENLAQHHTLAAMNLV